MTTKLNQSGVEEKTIKDLKTVDDLKETLEATIVNTQVNELKSLDQLSDFINKESTVNVLLYMSSMDHDEYPCYD